VSLKFGSGKKSGGSSAANFPELESSGSLECFGFFDFDFRFFLAVDLLTTLSTLTSASATFSLTSVFVSSTDGSGVDVMKLVFFVAGDSSNIS
jgi:hypothetical protein